jgi:hypothetical protein
VTNSDRIDMERMRIKDQATLKYGGGAGRAFLYGFTRGLVGESVADTIAQTFRNKQKTEQAYSRSFKRPDPIGVPEQPTLTSSGDEETKILLERVVAKIDDVAIKIEKINTRLKPTNITVKDSDQTFRYDPLAPEGKKVTVNYPGDSSSKFIALYGFDEFFETLPETIQRLEFIAKSGSKLDLNIPTVIIYFIK